MTTLPAYASETREQRDQRMKWFREARFGMFVHWGVYAVPAGQWQGKTGYGEWIMEQAHIPVSTYERFADEFNPTRYDPKKWARLARQAGMKYLVITSKHHDGFALFDSAVGDWDVGRTPWKKDLLKPLAEACKQEGIRFCTYHSIMDWHHPDYEPRREWNDLARARGAPNMDRYVSQWLKPQLGEIVKNYDPGIMWFDGEWESTWTEARGRDLESYVRSLSPNIIINNRVGKARNDMAGLNKPGAEPLGDYGTPEQEIPGTGPADGQDWESCMTMNNHWGYNQADKNYKSTTTLIQNLIDCASKGGNYLLNVGPTAEGEIPPESVERLAEIGKWMAVNGQAIYGTSASPFAQLAWGRATRNANTLYLFIFEFSRDAVLDVPMNGKISSVTLLSDPSRSLKYSSTDTLRIQLDGVTPDPHATVVVVKTDGNFRVSRRP